MSRNPKFTIFKGQKQCISMIFRGGDEVEHEKIEFVRANFLMFSGWVEITFYIEQKNSKAMHNRLAEIFHFNTFLI